MIIYVSLFELTYKTNSFVQIENVCHYVIYWLVRTAHPFINIILFQLLILFNRQVCSRKWRSFGRTGPVAINYHESPLGTGNHVKHWGTTTFPFTLANVFPLIDFFWNRKKPNDASKHIVDLNNSKILGQWNGLWFSSSLIF